MRKVLAYLVVAIVCFGCEPQILYFNVGPSSVGAGPATVTLNWKISVGDGELSADQPVTPSLNPPQKVYSQGSRQETVCQTTTFKLSLPYGGEQTATVHVAGPCVCGPQILVFTGMCNSSSQPPAYNTQTVNAALASGNIKDLSSNANFPIHVLHAGADIALGAGGGPIGALPAVPAAGDYTITVPGQVGIQVCQDAGGPVGGGPVPAPPVQLTVTPTCQ